MHPINACWHRDKLGKSLLVDVQQNREGDSDTRKVCWRMCSKIKRVILTPGKVARDRSVGPRNRIDILCSNIRAKLIWSREVKVCMSVGESGRGRPAREKRGHRDRRMREIPRREESASGHGQTRSQKEAWVKGKEQMRPEATLAKLQERRRGNPQFTSSPSQISAHCDGNSTSQESRTLDDDSDFDSDIDGNAYEDEPPPEAGLSRVDDDEFSFMDGDEIESAMADFDMSTLDDTVSDPLDIWYVKDQLLRILPHGHSAFKPFAAALKLSTFVYGRNDCACVEEVLNKNDETWNDVLSKQTAKIHRRVRRYIPPPASNHSTIV
ncbi:hypothetical protein C8J57DRAFT_1257221 [Mycena rebaudengoi]|nr:hypothetical protein C8J57DRAFT_1257221 [Mycena rebaudengoi]